MDNDYQLGEILADLVVKNIVMTGGCDALDHAIKNIAGKSDELRHGFCSVFGDLAATGYESRDQK